LKANFAIAPKVAADRNAEVPVPTDLELDRRLRCGPGVATPTAARVRWRAMSDTSDDGLRGRVQRQGEEALGRLAQELLESPLVHSAISRAFDAREKAVQAQEAAMGALNLPSAADLERLTRRVRSVSQRLEGIEDGVDRLDERLASLDERLAALSTSGGIEERLAGMEETLDKLTREVEAMRKKLPATPPRRASAAKKATT
jgi:chromosome segregation ATPase